MAEYTSDDPVQRLQAVRESISRCLNSQEYSIGNRRQRIAELRELRELEKDLINEIKESQGGGMSSLGFVQGPR